MKMTTTMRMMMAEAPDSPRAILSTRCLVLFLHMFSYEFTKRYDPVLILILRPAIFDVTLHERPCGFAYGILS